MPLKLFVFDTSSRCLHPVWIRLKDHVISKLLFSWNKNNEIIFHFSFSSSYISNL